MFADFSFNIKPSMSAIVIHVCRIEEVSILSGMQQRDASFEPQENFRQFGNSPVQRHLTLKALLCFGNIISSFLFCSVQLSILFCY